MQLPPREACSTADSNKLTVVMRMMCDDRCDAARLQLQLLSLFMLSLNAGVNASLVMSPRGYHKNFRCVESACCSDVWSRLAG